MRGDILIDVSAAVNQGAGIGRYARELTRALIPLLPAADTRLWFALDSHPADPQLPDRDPWQSLTATRSLLSRRNVDRFFFRGQLPAGPLLRSGSPAVSYSPDFTVPPGKSEHITVHDLAWLHPEAETPPPLASYLEPVVERAIQRATTVFTVSNTTRAEILERFALPEDRVVVAPNAPAARFFEPEALPPEHLATLGVQEPFLLFVGTIEPRKNLSTLLAALQRLPNEISLVVVGRHGWKADQQLEPISRPGLADRVVELGYIDDSTVTGLFAAAAALVYPSRYEGFGLPIVEALATGTPVAASDLAVFREVGEDEVEYFQPTDPADMARAIEALLASNRQGGDARQRRIARARIFDWRMSAGVVAKRLLAES